MDADSKHTRRFHQARWDEPVIFELNTPGARAVLPEPVDPAIAKAVGDGVSRLPEAMRRREPPRLPELSQPEVLRHYLRLSQQTLGADLNIDIGQGTCTMKYSPKVNEELARLPGMAELHPLQDESTVQGILEVINQMDLFLRAISGLDRFTFQPGGGSQALLAAAAVIRAYHASRGAQRDEIITTIFSHPSDAAAPAVAGFKLITLHPDESGLPRLEDLKAALSERTAGLAITNPEDTGIFNPRIAEFTRLVHDAGGLCSYDQANANGLLGVTRAREAGFDMCFFNLHKTFSTPHGSGGPAVGAFGVTRELERFLPVPLVDRDPATGRYSLNHDLPDSIGKVRGFYGSAAVILRAYAWVMSLGAEGLREVAEIAVLNNNYLLHNILKLRGASAPYAPGERRLEQVRYSWEEMTRETGVGSEDVGRRMADFGVHYWTSHHPWVVPEPFTLEPTESYSKAELDEYLAILARVNREAYDDPEFVKGAPYESVVHKMDLAPLDDPARRAVTWRAYVKKKAAWEAARNR